MSYQIQLTAGGAEVWLVLKGHPIRCCHSGPLDTCLAYVWSHRMRI